MNTKPLNAVYQMCRFITFLECVEIEVNQILVLKTEMEGYL